MSNKVVLGYWNIRGLAEPIRLLLEYTGTPYDERKYVAGPAPDFDVSDWTNEKDKLGLGDFPNLPYLIDGSKKLVQSCSILRYIGSKHNLCGTTEDERLAVDMLIHEVYDFKEEFIQLLYNEHNFEQRKAHYVESYLPRTLAKYESFLNNKKWLVGENITVPDFFFYEMVVQHLEFQPTCLDNCPNVKNYIARFAALPKIAEYLKSDRFIAHPINNTMSMWIG